MTTIDNPYIIEQKIDLSRSHVDDYILRKEKNKSEDPFVVFFDKSKEYSLIYEALHPSIVEYNYKDLLILEIPKEIKYLIESFKKSEYILELDDNWDDDNSQKYEFETWSKSLSFVTNYSKMLLDNFNKKIVAPKIYHGPKGTIDVLFENRKYTLLINILETEDKGIFYGEDDKGNNIKGEVNLNELNPNFVPLAFNF